MFLKGFIIPFAVSLALFLTGCSSTPKPPNCRKSDNVQRVNPEWVSEIADYSIPWDIHQDMKKEKIETIKTIRKRSKPFSQKTTPKPEAKKPETVQVEKKKKPLIQSPTAIINNMATTARAKNDKPLVFRRKPGKKKHLKNVTVPPKTITKKPKPVTLETEIQEDDIPIKETMMIPEGDDLPDYLQATPIQGPAQVKAVNIKPKKIEMTTAQVPTNKGHYVLHVGSYQQMNNALNSQSSLYEAGFPVYIRTVTIHNKEYHRVFVGPNLSLEEAKGFEQELKSIMQIKLYPSTHRFAQ